jgi:hypothetical protein
MSARLRLVTMLPLVVTLAAAPCEGLDAISRAVTVFNLPDVPPGPITQAVSRAVTVFNLPDVPPGPITQAVSRAVTVFNLPDTPPVLIAEAISRPLTVRSDPQTAVPDPILPHILALHAPQPNPFHSRAMLRFDLPIAGPVKLIIYDVRGARVATLIDALRPAGEQRAEWDGLDDERVPAPSGVYFARLETPSGIQTLKVTLSR